MRLAVFADVHSNIHAMQAVLDDIKGKKPDQVICAGDLVGYGAYPNQVIDTIRKQEVPTVMGNYDDGIGYHRLICGCDYKDEEAQRLGERSIMWTKKHTTEENKEFLRNLPKQLELTIGDKRILVVHGSPRRLNEYLFEDTSAEVLKEILEECGADVLICGHTHIPYHRTIDGRHVINVGSAGKPKHGDPNAVYALISVGDSVSVRFIKVPYDVEAAAKAIEDSDLPDQFAQLLRTGMG